VTGLTDYHRWLLLASLATGLRVLVGVTSLLGHLIPGVTATIDDDLLRPLDHWHAGCRRRARLSARRSLENGVCPKCGGTALYRDPSTTRWSCDRCGSLFNIAGRRLGRRPIGWEQR
jgi:ribosomal protein S27AE